MPFFCSRIPHDTVILSPQATKVSQLLLVFENHNSEVYLCVFCRMCLSGDCLVFFSWLDWGYGCWGGRSQREGTISVISFHRHTLYTTPPRRPGLSGWGHTYRASPRRALSHSSPFPNCAPRKAATVDRPPFIRNGELRAKPFRVEDIQTSFGILLDGRFGKFLINIYLSHPPTPGYVFKRNDNSGSHKNL